jgi:MFS family permease
MISTAASPPRLFTLVLLTGLSVLSLNMFLPSLSNIAEEFQADYALVNLSIAGYLGVTAAMQLVMGPLSDRLGRRPVLLAGLAIFIVSSLGCMLSTSIWAFLVFRVLQGAIISGRYAQRFPLTTMMIFGRLVGSAGLLLGLTLFAAGYINPFSLFGSTIFAGIGNGLTMPSANAGALSVRPGLAGSASGLAGALTVGGGAVLTSLTGVVLAVEYGVFQLLGIMLFCSLASLFAAIYVLRIDQRESGSGITTP